MPYTQYTQQALVTEIAAALGDPNFTWWSADEITRSIWEGMLYWGALTAYWRQRATFTTVAGDFVYDLAGLFPTLRARTYGYENITKEIQYCLLEPATGIAGTGMTTQFTIDQITSAELRARNQFVVDARIPLTTGTVAVSAPPGGRFSLTDDIALIQQAWWVDFYGRYSPLERIDPWEADNGIAGWPQSPTKPYSYSTIETMPLQVQLVPPPVTNGAMNMIFARTRTLPVSDISFDLPDEFILAVKYDAMGQLLDTYQQGFDPIRAKYCFERRKSMLETLQVYRTAFRTTLNGVPMASDALVNIDRAYAGWQNDRKKPRLGGLLFDLLAIAPAPDQGYGVEVDLVRSAPLTSQPLDYIQLGREEIPYLFNYCRHILSFKLGGAEFLATMPLYDDFIKGAQQRSQFNDFKARYFTPLFGMAEKETEIEPAA